jgi:SAM-dependent methyltransferase
LEKTIDFGHVADIYDYYTSTFFDIDFYKTLCRGRKNILEPMCGTGRISLPLIKEGYRLTCVDYSEEMLGVFRSKLRENEDVRIVCQDVCELDLQEKYDLIIVSANSISEIVDKEKRRRAFRRFYEHLAPNGIFFCSLYNPEYRIRMADGSIRYLGKFPIDGNKTLVITYYNLCSGDRKTVSGTQFYEIYENNRMTEKRCLDIHFSILTREEIYKTACEAGFTLKAMYGDYEPYHYDDNSMYMNFLFIKKKKKKR